MVVGLQDQSWSYKPSCLGQQGHFSVLQFERAWFEAFESVIRLNILIDPQISCKVLGSNTPFLFAWIPRF